MTVTGVSSQELTEQTGVTWRQVTWWVHKGYLVPIGGQQGSGGRHRYAPDQVARARWLKYASDLQAMSLPDLADLLAEDAES